MNLEEIQQAANENPELQQGLIKLVQDTDFGKEFLTNYAKVQVNEQIGTRIGELHGSYDKDIFESTGIEKNQGEKTYDYLKRSIADLKAANDSEALRVELENIKSEYEKVKQAGSGDEFLKNQLEAAKERNEQQAKALEEAQKAKADFENNVKVQMDIEKGMRNIKFKPGLPEYAKDRIENVKESIKSKARLVEGMVVYMDDNGKPIIDANFKNMTAEELLRKELGNDLIDNGEQRTGGDSKKEAGLIKDGEVIMIDVSGAKTRIEADKIMNDVFTAKGIMRGSEEHRKISHATYEKIKDLPLR
jgi:hypothetical protein